MANLLVKEIQIDGVVYDLRDKYGPDGALTLLGVTSTEVTDGGREAPTIGGTVVPVSSLKVGNVVLWREGGDDPQHYNEYYSEFVWVPNNEVSGGYAWELLGAEGSYVLKGTYTTQGTPIPTPVIGAPGWTGTAGTVTVTGPTVATNLPVSENAAGPTITFSTVSTGTVGVTVNYVNSGKLGTLVDGTKSISITSAIPTGTYATYQPSGTISVHNVTTKSFTGSPTDVSVTTNTPVVTKINHVAVNPNSFGLAPTYTTTPTLAGDPITVTPGGTISKPAITVSKSSSTTTVVTGVSASSTNTVITYDATNERLIWPSATYVTSATVTSTTTPITYMTSASAALSATPVFYGNAQTITPSGKVALTGVTVTGTSQQFEASYDTANVVSTGSVTPQGAIDVVISNHTFTGDQRYLQMPTIAVSAPALNSSATFYGDTFTITKQLVAAVAANKFTSTGPFTPQGTISAPTITSWDSTHTHTIVFQ